MKIPWRLVMAGLLATCGVDDFALAQEKDARPVAIPLGPMDLIPLLDVSESYSDNIFYNDLNRKGSMVTQIHSGVGLALERRLNRFALNYAFQSSQYHSSPDDNYVDQYLVGRAHVEFTSRNRLDFDAKYIDAHDQRGTAFSQGDFAKQIKEPDQFHQYSAAARYRYGGERAKGNLGLIVGVDDVTYDNHPERTSQWDRTEIGLTPEFYYRLFPKTYLLTQIEMQWVAYKNNQPGALSDNSLFANLDYTKRRYLAGLTWEVSSQTTGKASIGYLQQEFDNKAFEGVNDITWDVGVQWSPWTYTRFDLGLSRDIQPTLGFGTARLIESYRLGWTHHWNSRLTTALGGEYQRVDNRGVSRQDDIYGFRVDVGYTMQRWLIFGINYTYQSQQSTFNTLDYEQNVIMFYIAGNPRASREFKHPWQSWY